MKSSRKSGFTKVLAVLLFSLPLAGYCQSVSIGVGEKLSDVEIQLRKMGAIDITDGIESVVLEKNVKSSGSYWNIPSVKSVVSFGAKDGSITAICYWTEKDFSENKVHREATKLFVQGL